MKQETDEVNRLLKLESKNIFVPLSAGFSLGAIVLLFKLDPITMEGVIVSIIGGGFGGAMFFGVVWAIANYGKSSYPLHTAEIKASYKPTKSSNSWILGAMIITLIIGMAYIQNNSPSSKLESQLQPLSDKIMNSAMTFNQSLNQIQQLENIDTMSKMNKVISIIEEAQLIQAQGQQNVKQLSRFIEQNRAQLIEEGWQDLVDEQGLYETTYYYSYQLALKEHLSAYKTMLEYAKDNLEAIAEGQNPQTDTYRQLDRKFRSAGDKVDEADQQRQIFIKQYVSKHPSLKSSINKAQQHMK